MTIAWFSFCCPLFLLPYYNLTHVKAHFIRTSLPTALAAASLRFEYLNANDAISTECFLMDFRFRVYTTRLINYFMCWMWLSGCVSRNSIDLKTYSHHHRGQLRNESSCFSRTQCPWMLRRMEITRAKIISKVSSVFESWLRFCNNQRIIITFQAPKLFWCLQLNAFYMLIQWIWRKQFRQTISNRIVAILFPVTETLLTTFELPKWNTILTSISALNCNWNGHIALIIIDELKFAGFVPLNAIQTPESYLINWAY